MYPGMYNWEPLYILLQFIEIYRFDKSWKCVSSHCCWSARFLRWTLFDASKYSFGILIYVYVCVCVCVCWLCITQFSWTITLSKAWFGICCHTQATTVMMTRSDILLVWTWELVMFISWITQHTLCKCAVLWIIVRLNILTLCGFS